MAGRSESGSGSFARKYFSFLFLRGRRREQAGQLKQHYKLSALNSHRCWTTVQQGAAVEGGFIYWTN